MRYRDLQLDRFQEEAIRHLERGSSVLVCAPTGTGKTLIADYLVEQTLGEGRRLIYTAPVKALSNQKFRRWREQFGDDAVGLTTGDRVLNPGAPCRVMTTEILRNMLLSGEDLSDLAAVVLDELHYLADPQRGTVWEEVLIHLPSSVLIVGLSATLSNQEQFASWLTAVRQKPVEVVTETQRAVPLEIRLFNRELGARSPAAFLKAASLPSLRREGRRGGRPHRQERGGRTSHVQVVRALRRELPLLYFTVSRRDAQRFAEGLGRKKLQLLSPERHRAMRAALKDARDRLGGELLKRPLVELLEQGIAYHHAGLHVHLKLLIEKLYERRLIQVLYTTSTFALGVDMPARSVVFDSLKRYNGREMAPLTVREFTQQAGRAGRRGQDQAGTVVLKVERSDVAELSPWIQRYVAGESEPVRSAFNLSYHSVVQLLRQHSLDEIQSLLQRSFLSYSLKQHGLEEERQLARLEEQLKEKGWTEGQKVTARTRSLLKRRRRLQRRIRRSRDRVWEHFLKRYHFLQGCGYLGEDGELLAGGRLLCHLQFQELLSAELILSGLLYELDSAELYGVLCCMSGRLPRGATPSWRITREQRGLLREITRMRRGALIQDAEELAEQEWTWEPKLFALGVQWAEGKELAVLSRIPGVDVDWSGQLVAGLRRARDLGRQLRAACREDPILKPMIDEALERSARDEVMALE